MDSVLNQTFTDWNAVLVNDGSPDNSAAILAEYAARDKRFVVVTKENGGLSDARNAGLPYATGKYIMYMDSDDFIHPQFMEIAYYMATRDNSDMVSFTYDRAYRPRLMLRHVLGLNTDNVMPRGIKHRYKPAKIRTLITDDIYQYATERAHNMFHPRRRWLVKHCQVWRNMYRRELIADIGFIKGILFEDFPWWSAVMLKNPRTTIVNLPLYYYVPNFGGIVLSAKQLRIMQSLCAGIRDAHARYIATATPYQMQQWSINFKWYFINWAWRKVRYLDNDGDIATARQYLIELKHAGVFDDAPNKFAKKIRAKIYDFLK